MLWVIGYDISDDPVRREVEKYLLARGERVQRSVFECYLSLSHREALEQELRLVINPETDSVRFYPLCRWCDDNVSVQGCGQRAGDESVWIV